MPLPKIATPSYELELPSTGKTIQYRPFLVKEEKLLVIALESEDTKQITNAIKAVIRACCLLYTSPSPRDRQKSRMPSSA